MAPDIKFQDMGSASARVFIDTTQAAASVPTMQKIAEQFAEIISGINKSIGGIGSGTNGVEASALKLQVEQIKAATAERLAQSQVETARIKADSNERIAQMRLEAKAAQDASKAIMQAQQEAARKATSNPAPTVATTKLPTVSDLSQAITSEKEAQDKLIADALAGVEQWAQAERGRAVSFNAELQQEKEAQDKLVADALSGVDQWAAAQRQRHDAQMQALLKEAEAQSKSTSAASLQPINPNVVNQQDAQAQQQAVVQQEQQLREKVLNEIRITQARIAEARGQITAQANQFQQANAIAPASVDRSDVQQQLAAAKEPIIELQNQLGRLKTAYLQATTPAEQNALIPELQRIQAEALAAANQGMNPLINSVEQFEAATENSTSGIQGYFEMIRKNLEITNETSLAANLQEISFRLLPLGLATGAATKTGIDTAQQIQEMALSFNSFTKSQKDSNELMDSLIAKAEKFGLPMTEVLTTMQKFAPTIREAGGNLNEIMDLAARVLTLDPSKGFTAAIEAITKGLGGTDRSLLSQFHILPDTIKDAAEATGSFTAGLDKVLNDMGRTTQVAQSFGETSRAAFTRLSDSTDRFLATSMKPFLDGLTAGADGLSNFFDQLESGGGIVATITGGFLLLTSALTSSLVTLSQLALGLAALKALLPTGFASNLFAGAVENLTAILPEALVTAFSAAAGAIGSVVSSAITTGIALAGPALVVALGAALGLGVAAAAHVGGVDTGSFGGDLSAQFERLKQILFVAISAISEPFFIGVSVIKAAIDSIGAAIDLIGTTLAKGANDLADQIVIAIQGIGRTFGIESLKSFGSDRDGSQNSSRFVVTSPDGQYKYTYGAAGAQAGTKSQFDAQAKILPGLETGSTIKFIEGYTERIARLTETLEKGPNVKAIADAGLAAADSFKKSALGVLFPPDASKGVGALAGGLVGGAGGGAGIDPDAMEKIYAATVENMISITRTLEDRTLAAKRSAEDYALQQQRATEDFAKQRVQAEDDYNTSRLQKIDDFNRQSDDAVKQEQDQRAKQTKNFQDQELRAAADHLKAMQRLAEDVDDAISARDFLSAQKTLENMQRQEEDFQTQDGRRKEDFQAQLKDLDDNLADQQQKRKDDFARQLKQADDAFRLQQQRQVQNFQLQQQRQDQDRARTLARQQEDFAIADSRRQIDFNRQIAQLIGHNDNMAGLWDYGLGQLRTATQNFFRQLPDVLGTSPADTTVRRTASTPSTPATSVAYTIGSLLGGGINTLRSLIGATSNLGTGTAFNNAGTAFQSFDNGAWEVPHDMKNVQLQGGEVITPMPFAKGYRNALSEAGGGGKGDTYAISFAIDASGSNMNEDALVDKFEKRVVPKFIAALEAQAQAKQARRGTSG